MKYDISGTVKSVKLLETRLKIIIESTSSKSILDIKGIKALSGKLSGKISTLEIFEEVGSFAYDVALHLKSPEIKKNLELRCFGINQELIFKAVAEKAEIKPYTKFISLIENE